MCDILFNLLYLFSFPYHLTQLILCSKLSYMPFVCLLHDIISCGKVETLMFPVHSESLKYNFCERTNCLTFRFYSFSAGLLSLGNRPTMEGDKHQPRASFSTLLSAFCRWKILISEFFSCVFPSMKVLPGFEIEERRPKDFAMRLYQLLMESMFWIVCIFEYNKVWKTFSVGWCQVSKSCSFFFPPLNIFWGEQVHYPEWGMRLFECVIVLAL